MKETVFIFQELFVAITFERYQFFTSVFTDRQIILNFIKEEEL